MGLKIVLLFTILFLNSCLLSFKSSSFSEQYKMGDIRYRIMFWNVENLFDNYNDSNSKDDEFSPEGIRRWNYSRYIHKINNIYKVFIASGNPHPPEIIGLCEIENRLVLDDLVVASPFGKYEYKILHKDSDDERGIDVAIIYNPRAVSLIYADFIRPVFSSPDEKKTRDILYMKGFINGDTINMFVCHFPSKYGGSGLTEILRKDVARNLKKLADSIQESDRDAKIIICGDMNDPPHSESISRVLKTMCYNNGDEINDEVLYNLSCNLKPGSYKYNGIWENIDQFIVSGSFLKTEKKQNMQALKMKAEIFCPDFLLEQDDIFSGMKPFRTWEGMKYKGGFSDHLPVILNVY